MRAVRLVDMQGAIVALGKTPLGSVRYHTWTSWLCFMGIIRAAFDPLHKGTDFKGILERLGYAISGLSYMLLAFATYGLITGGTSAARNGAEAAQTQQTTASILSKSWGAWIVGIVAVILIGVGLSQVFQGLRSNFEQQFQPYALSNNQRTWIYRLGQFGTVARGVVFTLVGIFLFLAAYHHDPSQAKGIDGVLTALLLQPYGVWLLGVVRSGWLLLGFIQP